MSIRRTRPSVQTQDATGALDHARTGSDIAWNVPDRGPARLSRDQTQLDDDRELANPEDLGKTARLQRRQRDLDGLRGRPRVPGPKLTPTDPPAESPPAENPPAESTRTGADELVRAVTPVLESRPQLIIADDDPVICSMLKMSLSDEFDVVGMAADSEGAIELARVNQPDAAVIDVDMPKGGGLSAVRGILEVAPATAIVMLSGDESDMVVRELMQAGAMAYLRKGSAPQVLSDCLTESIKANAHGVGEEPLVAASR